MAKPLLLVEGMAAGNDSGLGRYVRLLLACLDSLRGDARIRVLAPPDQIPSGLDPLRMPARPYRVICETVWPAAIAALRPKAVLCLGQTLPALRPPSRYALMVPDAGPLENLPIAASGHPEFNRRWMRSRLPKADRILTCSEFTRRRLHALLGVDPGKVSVVPPVRPSEPSPPATEPPFPGPYFLAVGNVEPRKNYPGLVRAYAQVLRRIPDLPPLHILGHEAWDGGAARAAIAESGLESRVLLHGHVSETRRQAFLRGCALFVNASWYEGFGLPLFEALQAGKACIYQEAAEGGAQGEFAAGFAYRAAGGDPESLAEALETVWTRPGLRQSLEAGTAGFAARRRADPAEALRQALLPLLA